MNGDVGTIVFLGLLGVTVTGGKYILSGFRRRKQRHLIEETPTADVESMSIGPAELVGTARSCDGVIDAPFTDEECLYCAWEIEEWQETDDGDSWERIAGGTEIRPFLLDDGTGEVRVEATDGAEWEIEEWKAVVAADESPPTGIQGFLDQEDTVDGPTDPSMLDLGNQDGDRRYTQRVLRRGEETYVYGAVRNADGDGTNLVVGPATSRVDADMFFISDSSEAQLLDRRDWTLLWRLPVGAALVALGVAGYYVFFF